jgi:hypothetical protein
MADRNARQEAPTPQAHTPPVFNWPHDEEGRPLALITMGVSELFGIPGTFSNVMVGPAQATTFVGPNDSIDDEMKEAIKQGIKDVLGCLEEVMAENREAMLEIVSQIKAGTNGK